MKRALLIASGHVDKYFAERVISALREIENPIMFAAADGGKKHTRDDHIISAQ